MFASHPDDEPNQDNAEEMNRREFFKPRFFPASDWTSDDAAATALRHCANNMRKPDVSNATSAHNILFSNICKLHHSHAQEELTLRGAVFERIKTNSEGKEVNIGMKDLAAILKSVMCPNESEASENMSPSECIRFKSFKPTHLAATEWTNLPNVNTNPNHEN